MGGILTSWTTIITMLLNLSIFGNCLSPNQLTRLLTSNPALGTIQSPGLAAFGIGKSRQVAFAKETMSSDFGPCKLSPIKKKLVPKGPTIIIATDHESIAEALTFIDKENLGTSKPVILIYKSNSTFSTSFRIDQEVFMINTNTWEMRESYVVNGQHMDLLVGNYTWHLASRASFLYKDENHWMRALGKRRTDLFGQHLSVMTDEDYPYTTLDPDFESKAVFHEKNGTYELTGFVTGLYQEILDLLAKELNFTYTLYKRQDRVWGAIGEDGKPEGILGDLWKEENGADLVAAAFGMILLRAPYVQYLPPISDYKPGLFIKRQFKEAFNWYLYVQPFHADLWIGVFAVSIVIAFWFSCISGVMNKKQVHDIAFNFVAWWWVALMANLGGKPQIALPKRPGSNRVVIFTCLLAGTVIWIAYRASLTSELSVTSLIYPFNSLPELLETSYTLGTHTKGSAIASLFEQAPEGTTYSKLVKDHMTTEDSFVMTKQGLEMVKTKDEYAFFDDEQLIYSLKEYQCEIKALGRQAPLFHMSFAMRKNSPYYPTLKWGILHLKERGILDKLKTKYLLREPKCDPVNKGASALGLNKAVMMLFILVVGFVTAGLVFLMEQMCQGMKKSKQKFPESKEEKYHKHQVAATLTKIRQFMDSLPPKIRSELEQFTVLEFADQIQSLLDQTKSESS